MTKALVGAGCTAALLFLTWMARSVESHGTTLARMDERQKQVERWIEKQQQYNGQQTDINKQLLKVLEDRRRDREREPRPTPVGDRRP